MLFFCNPPRIVYQRRPRRALLTRAPSLKAAIQAEQEAFRLKRELQRLDIEDPEPVQVHALLIAVHRGGNMIDMDRLPRRKVRDDEP